MNTTLLENPDQTVCGPRREVELSALVEKLLGEVAELRDEVATLRQQAGYWKAMFEQAKRKNEKLQKEIDTLRAENRQLKDRLFAAKSEKKSSKDRSNGLDDPKTVNTPRRARGHQPGASGPQRRAHSHLPVVEEEIELPSDETACPKCGKPAAEMSETEDSEVIELEVRAHRRKIRRKRYRRTCDCHNELQTLTAPAPPKLIPKGRYGASVWVHLLLAKFASHRALGVLERRHDRLSNQTHAEPRRAPGALCRRGPRRPHGRSLFGLQGDGSSQVGNYLAGLLLGSRASRLHRRRQGLAGACRLGHRVAASYSPTVPSESAATIVRRRNV